MSTTLCWDATFEIALALQCAHPTLNLETVSLDQVYQLTVKLPGFDDDLELANDEILMTIYQEWLELIIHHY